MEGAVLAEPVAGTHIHDKALVDGRCGEIGYECHDKPYGTDKQNDTEYEIEDIILEHLYSHDFCKTLFLCFLFLCHYYA